MQLHIYMYEFLIFWYLVEKLKHSLEQVAEQKPIEKCIPEIP